VYCSLKLRLLALGSTSPGPWRRPFRRTNCTTFRCRTHRPSCSRQIPCLPSHEWGGEAAREGDSTFDGDVDRFRGVRSIELPELFLSVGDIQGFCKISVGGLHDAACARFRIGVLFLRSRRVWWCRSQKKVGESEHHEQSAGVYCHNVGVGHCDDESDRRRRALMDSDQYLDRLEDFLTSPLPKSLFTAHPNDIAKPSFIPPSEWETWWDWAASTPVAKPWIELLNYYVALLSSDSYPHADGCSLRRSRGKPLIFLPRSPS